MALERIVTTARRKLDTAMTIDGLHSHASGISDVPPLSPDRRSVEGSLRVGRIYRVTNYLE